MLGTFPGCCTLKGASFLGLVLGGIATSLPEVSTTVSAVRLRQYEMAFADAFGTNLFSVMLVSFADVAYPDGPVLNEGGRFSLFAILLGMAKARAIQVPALHPVAARTAMC